MVNAQSMDLRDWYAGQAMLGILAQIPQPLSPVPPYDAELIARRAFDLADAMIKEREKPAE